MRKPNNRKEQFKGKRQKRREGNDESNIKTDARKKNIYRDRERERDGGGGKREKLI